MTLVCRTWSLSRVLRVENRWGYTFLLFFSFELKLHTSVSLKNDFKSSWSWAGSYFRGTRQSLGSLSSIQEPKDLIGQLGTVYSALQCSNNVVNIIFYSCIKREGLWELKTIYVRPLVILLLTKIWTPGTPLWSVFSIQEKPFLFLEECGMSSWTSTPRYPDL